MRQILPGKPQAKLQALCAVIWDCRCVVAYISGNALVILGGPHDLIQTIYHEDSIGFDAVSINKSDGKIAVSNEKETYIYGPYGKDEGSLKWSLQCCLGIPEEERGMLTLSWGLEEELLIGSKSLRLFRIASEDDVIIWSEKLSRPVKFAVFSPDANLVACTGFYDRLIKLWRRQSSGMDGTKFDFTYLSHPSAVTALQWRTSKNPARLPDNILYSICADKKIRIWAASDPHGLQVLQQWAEIDMMESIQPRQIESLSASHERYAFFIDSDYFISAVKSAGQVDKSERREESHGLEHLEEMVGNVPEVCVVLDGKGNMSAWGLEDVTCKVNFPPKLFNIAHVENLKLWISPDAKPDEKYVQVHHFSGPGHQPTIKLLVHHFDGRIEWLEGSVDKIFDPSAQPERLRRKCVWTGHDGSVKKIVRSGSGETLLSRTNDNEGLIWKQERRQGRASLTRASLLSCPDHIHRTCLIGNGDFVVNLHHHSISLWDVRYAHATQVALLGFEIEGDLLCLLLLREPSKESCVIHVATITSRMKGIAWEIQLGNSNVEGGQSKNHYHPNISQFCLFDLGLREDIVFVLPVDPAGSPSTTSSFLDTFAKDIAISYTSNGMLRAWTAVIDLESSSISWLTTSKVDTGIDNPSLASGSSIRKTAVVDASRTGMTIWDVSSAQLEYDVHYEAQDLIQDLDWSSTPDDQSILAVGFPHKVVILSQMRFDYINGGPAWAPIRQIYLKECTPHPIGDSTWLGSGNLVVGSGNQLYVYDTEVTTADELIVDLSIPVHSQKSATIFDLVSYLNGPLPLFHPQFLGQCILAGKLEQVQKIIINLHQALQLFSPGDELSSFLNVPLEAFYSENSKLLSSAKELRSLHVDFLEAEPEIVSEDLAASLNDKLTRLALPYLSSREQIHLADMIECVATVEKYRRSMDDCAMRYLLFFRQHMLRKLQNPPNHMDITWREIAWAYHSGSQEILIDLVSRQYHGRMLWEHARESGMFMWMTDLSTLRVQLEVIARNEYTKTDEKNPINCSLYYLALKKKTILLGLWRMATWNREQSSTQKLLSNNFQERRWKTAALKNAYALLGKRRFKYAAAFFLLAGNLRDAVNVCAHQMQDLQLAIAIARVYEGDDGVVLRSLLEDRCLPLAALEGNRWLASWSFWMLGRRDMAVHVLISPVYTLLDSPETPNMEAKSYLATDPALVVFYKHLREKTVQTLRGASKIPPRAEWEFVIQNARLYDRMGCDLLALDLVRNWEFLVKGEEEPSHNRTISDPRKMLRRRSSLVVDDLPSPSGPGSSNAKLSRTIKQPPAQKVFEEPDANSLLDSFGF